MKKKFLVIGLLSLIFLSGCQAHKTVSRAPDNETIKQNQMFWEKRVNNAGKIDQPKLQTAFAKLPVVYHDEDMSWERLKNGNQYLIEGQVVNLSPMLGQGDLIETKVSLYVQKVISGDKSLQNQNIKLVLPGGLARTKDIKPLVQTSKKTSYTVDAATPLPKIGQKIIVGVGKFRPENGQQKDSYARYNLTTKNLYTVNNQEVTFWIRRNKKFVLNNPGFNAKKYPQLAKITTKLNQGY